MLFAAPFSAKLQSFLAVSKDFFVSVVAVPVPLIGKSAHTSRHRCTTPRVFCRIPRFSRLPVSIVSSPGCSSSLKMTKWSVFDFVWTSATPFTYRFRRKSVLGIDPRKSIFFSSNFAEIALLDRIKIELDDLGSIFHCLPTLTQNRYRRCFKPIQLA
jgi:hypothetical protein